MAEIEKKPVKIVETILRDAHQSLIATRMTTEPMMPIVEKMDKVGYHAVECWGGATFDASLRFLKEDPWERLRKFRDGFKNTKLQMLLLIFGAYIPVITAIKGILSLDFSYIPNMMFFGCGVLAGTVTVVKAIKVCLENYRTQTVYMILGMMIGSFYAIIMGPTTLEVPQAALNLRSFQIISAVAGVSLVLGMQLIKERSVINGN